MPYYKDQQSGQILFMPDRLWESAKLISPGLQEVTPEPMKTDPKPLFNALEEETERKPLFNALENENTIEDPPAPDKGSNRSVLSKNARPVRKKPAMGNSRARARSKTNKK